MNHYEKIKSALKAESHTWLVTGAAGFIGSHLVETLLKLNQNVVGLDNFATGKQENLEDIKKGATPEQWNSFQFVEGDIADLNTCEQVCEGVDYVVHQGALGSVPRSIENPLASHRSNDIGMINMLVASRDAKVLRFVYASSSSVYGDDPELPKVEDHIGKALSPYAATKLANEIYAEVFARCYGLQAIGLRYFNVFGARQDPNGAYAAVIPQWVSNILRREQVYVNGTGETSRDFCYIDNVVQVNLLAAVTSEKRAINQVYNVAVNDRTSLNDLFVIIRDLLQKRDPELQVASPEHRDFRKGDVMHTLADIRKSKTLLGYEPTHSLRQGLEAAIDWYRENL